MWFKSILTLILDIATVISYPILSRFDNWYVYQMSFLCINFGNFFCKQLYSEIRHVRICSISFERGGGGQTDRKGIVTSFLSKNSRGDPSVHPVHELNSSVQTSTTIDY